MSQSLYYSHSRKDDTGQAVGSKLLQDHTQGVLARARAGMYDRLGFRLLSQEDLELLLEKSCLLHDFGKYTSYFQAYLLGKSADRTLRSHARIGAHLAFQTCSEDIQPGLPAFLAYFLVLHHHLNLRAPATSADKLFTSSEIEEITEMLEAQIQSLQQALPLIRSELGLPTLSPTLPGPKEMGRSMRMLKKEGTQVEHYFLINYLFSLLIEADKLDASDTGLHVRQPLPYDAVDLYLHQIPYKVSQLFRTREVIRAEVMLNLEGVDILSKRLMLLTAPTGLGKTLTALDFALKLRSLVFEETGRQAQIITALPFINIIEQTLAAYKKVLAPAVAENPAIQLLAHYQYADVLGEQKDHADQHGYEQKLMQLDTWQADIVITSFVQLLQTLITNRNKLLKKFNHLAGAIVIMDEVQSIRLEQVPLVGAMLFYLAKFLDTRLILMTATQPMMFELADRHILSQRGESASDQLLHLVKSPERFFRSFSRTQLIPLMQDPIHETADFLSLLEEFWSPDKSCLIVCNKVKRSLDLFELVRSWLAEKGFSNQLFYLSTNIIPAHRLAVIEELRQCLSAGGDIAKKKDLPPILIATQVVEAGVDLDFDLGFRDVGPIDSIIQVAGRINRENRRSRKFSPLYVVDFGDCKDVYSSVTYQQALLALGQKPIPEPDYYELVQRYFQGESTRKAFTLSQKYFHSIETLNYDGNEEYPISSFEVIEHSTWATNVFIEWDEEASAALQAFRAVGDVKKANREQAKKHFDQRHKLAFHQHVIAVPKYLVKGNLSLIDERIPDLELYILPREQVVEQYDLLTGFIRTKNSAEDQHKFYSF